MLLFWEHYLHFQPLLLVILHRLEHYQHFLSQEGSNPLRIDPGEAGLRFHGRIALDNAAAGLSYSMDF